MYNEQESNGGGRQQAPEALPEPEVSSATHFRFRLAGAMRLSDALVARAVGAYERVFTLDAGEQADIYVQLGSELGASGRGEEARAALRQAIALRPDDPQAWFQLGLVQLRQGASGAALDAFEKARALGMVSFDLHYRMAEALADRDRHEAAAEEIRGAIRLDPDSAQAHCRLGVELDCLKRHEEAVGAFERAIELAPREPSFYQSLGFTLDGMGRREQAIACFKRAVELERRASQGAVRP
ncbi:MAG: tetratricopeptide repeat protein [Deltaproteobacteria bacterium]|nr:tetratricopeptide repeat protein [Deltaproteobacteria bacterium]